MYNKQLKQIIKHYGSANQMEKSIEEMAELTQALVKFDSNPCIDTQRHVVEEIADVIIMMCQLSLIFDCEDGVDRMIEYKIKRTLEGIKNE